MSLNQLISRVPGLSSLGGGTCVGVDIGSTGVKVAQCSGSSVPISIKKLIWQPAGEALSSGKFRLNVQGAGLGNRDSSFSIADEKVESYEFKLPKLKPKELATAMDWEIKKTVASSEFAFHDVLLSENELGFDVQCIVASKDIVNSRFEEAKSFGFSPSYLETESAALLAAATLLKGGAAPDRTVIIDLGYSAFRLVFVHQGKISFTRSLYLGLGPITELIASHDVAAAANMVDLFKRLKANQPEGEGVSPEDPVLTLVERATQEALYTLCEEFRRSEFFAKEQKNLENIEEILLCGGGACIPYAVEYLGGHLSDKKILVLDPFQWAKKLPEGFDPSSGPLWTCAVGLSLRNVT